PTTEEQQSGSNNTDYENGDAHSAPETIAKSDASNDNDIDKDKGGRPNTNWNNVLENNPMKEKFPPPTTTNLTHTDNSERQHSVSTAAITSSNGNNNTSVGGGKFLSPPVILQKILLVLFCAQNVLKALNPIKIISMMEL
ncbi:MAG: hypothetical protein ACJ71R_10135, partial [Nitrososphaeraceae archaeon]